MNSEIGGHSTVHQRDIQSTLSPVACSVRQTVLRKRERVFATDSRQKFQKSTVTNHRNANSDSMTSFYKLDLLMINHEEFL